MVKYFSEILDHGIVLNWFSALDAIFVIKKPKWIMHWTPVLLFRSAICLLCKTDSKGGHETTTIKRIKLVKSKRGSWSSIEITESNQSCGNHWFGSSTLDRLYNLLYKCMAEDYFHLACIRRIYNWYDVIKWLMRCLEIYYIVFFISGSLARARQPQYPLGWRSNGNSLVG